MTTNYACWYSEVDCDKCTKLRYCNANALIEDLSAERYTCLKCGKTTKEEWVKYCPFCGIKIEWDKT